jgi:cell pole-organizing protein PopZ
MNDPKIQQEPSMEEILASIRRIISEEEPAEENKAEASPDEQDSEDVLELTEIAEEAPEEVASIPDPPEETEEEIDFDSPLAERKDDLELREEAGIPEEEPEEAELPAELPVMEPPPVLTVGNSLIGKESAGSATGSLASLVAAVDRAQGGALLSDANRTIEDLVKEVMRPMIREWLDENLPGLVDRLVRREIERLSRSAEGDC